MTTDQWDDSQQYKHVHNTTREATILGTTPTLTNHTHLNEVQVNLQHRG